MQHTISIQELRNMIDHALEKLQSAGIQNLDLIEVPIIVYSSYKNMKRYGINVSNLGFNKGKFLAVKLPNANILILLYKDDE